MVYRTEHTGIHGETPHALKYRPQNFLIHCHSDFERINIEVDVPYILKIKIAQYIQPILLLLLHINYYKSLLA